MPALGQVAKASTSAPLAGLFDLEQWQANGPIRQLGPEQLALLERVRAIDPNAQWKYNDFSGSSNEGGATPENTYSLQFDQTKLPRTGLAGQNMPAFNSAGQASGIQSTDPSRFRGRLYNDRYRVDSPYGQITDSRNVNTQSPSDMIYSLAPAIIMAIATGGAGAGLLGGMLGGGAAGAGASAPAWLVSGINGLLSGASQGRLNTGSLAGLAGGAFGLPSWMTQLGSLAAGQLRNRGGKG